MIVLDSSAFLARVKREPGAEAMDAVMAEAAMSVVNVAEILSKISDWGLDEQAYIANLASVGAEFVDFTLPRAAMAAQLRRATRPFGLSLGDRACLALAIERNCSVLTADRNWSKIAIGVSVKLIR